jgi:iron(III) transport system substrate-binding protein
MVEAVSRRSIIGTTGFGACAFAASPFLSRAMAGNAVESAVEWARKNLPNSTPDIVNGAGREGRLTLSLYNLGGNDEAIQALIKGFSQRYPFVAVDYTRYSTVQLLNKFNAELNSRRGISDFVNLPSNAITNKALIEKGAIAKFVVSEDTAFPRQGKRSGLWYAWHNEQATTVYRTDALTDEEKKLLRTFRGLGDPRFKGRIAINAITNSLTLSTSYMLMYGPDPHLWEGLARNRPQVKPASNALVSCVLAGEADIGVMCGAASPMAAAKGGAPLVFGLSAPYPTLHTPCAISSIAPHPNAARLWQDWSTSSEGQNIWVRESGMQSVRTGLKEKGWAEQQPWFFAAPPNEFDWDAFYKKQNDVVARFTRDIQGSRS